MSAAKSDKLTTPIFRVSFPSVFKPRQAQNPTEEPKYEITMLFPKGTDLTPLLKAAVQAAEAKWGSDRRKWPGVLATLDPKTYLSPVGGQTPWPFRDGDTAAYDGYAGMISLKATSKTRPGIVAANGQTLIEDESDFYAGCWARATVVAFAYDNKSKGVSFGLNNLQKIRDDEAFSGRGNPLADFDAVEGADDPANYAAPGSATSSMFD
jgi:hypothetical protein